MYKKVYAFGLLVIGWMWSLKAMAQDGAGDRKVEMADSFRANGKIYVVIAVALIILLGLLFYVSRLDRKISKYEKEVK
ncbi:MAG TPA: hypothetical protein VGQ51_19265 [Puia sp.]|jgi:hypothetical protein|nr:hypothetical protein [Puia sp.]